GAKVVTRFGNSGPPFDPLEGLGGSLLQVDAISPECAEFVPPQANVVISRITTSAFGGGLIEAIKAGDIVRRDPYPPPAARGRARRRGLRRHRPREGLPAVPGPAAADAAPGHARPGPLQ